MANVALLHYWMTNVRGGEKVLAQIATLYPKAHIYTHAYAPGKMGNLFVKYNVSETLIGKLPFARKFCQKYLLLMPYALKHLDLTPYDLIISSESGPIKGIRKPENAVHICYCHTPMRYLWDLYQDYYQHAGVFSKVAMKLFFPYLKKYDRKSADSVDYFIANSNFVANRIRRIYNRESIVIYPPVDTEFFQQNSEEAKQDYYLFAGQLVDYKRPDLAIRSCLKLGRRLFVIGAGEERSKLEKLCGGNSIITFDSNCSNEELRHYYAKAKALIFPGVEDFGMVPVEAQAAGTPVIAFGAGGVLETVSKGRTGLFFYEQTVDSLCEAIVEFEKHCWDSKTCQANAERFSKSVFEKRFREFVRSVAV